MVRMEGLLVLDVPGSPGSSSWTGRSIPVVYNGHSHRMFDPMQRRFRTRAVQFRIRRTLFFFRRPANDNNNNNSAAIFAQVGGYCTTRNFCVLGSE